MVACILQEMASLENDTERKEECRNELDELEERAKELDQRRTNNISAIRSYCPECSVLHTEEMCKCLA